MGCLPSPRPKRAHCPRRSGTVVSVPFRIKGMRHSFFPPLPNGEERGETQAGLWAHIGLLLGRLERSIAT